MPRPRQTISASSDFLCSASAVWRVLTNEQSYKEWFGYPKTLNLDFIEPGFVAGARLEFKGMTTLVITALTQDHLLSFSNNSCSISFKLTAFDEFIDVTISVDIMSAVNPFGETEDLQRFLRETLRALKKAAGIVPVYPAYEPSPDDTGKKSLAGDFLTRVFAGYRPPVVSEKNNADAVYSTLIDNTEVAVTIGRRALLVSIAFVCLFFATIGIALSFQRSDIVPSSGLSLFESNNVNKYMSTLIRIGEEKQALEIKLSCQGERKVNADSSIEFHYASLDKDDDGNTVEHISVIYDAYGRVRRFAYINTIQSSLELYREPSSGKLREGMNYYEMNDKNILLSSSMNLYEVEEIIGVPVSAYMVEKNGDSFITTYYFGRFFAGDIFDCNYKSQIVVTLNEVTGVTGVSYYNPISDGNPLPLDELTRTLRRQYAGLDEYLIDRFAYERIFLLFDIHPEQAELILGVKGISLNSGAVKTAGENETSGEVPEKNTEQSGGELPKPEETVYESYVYRTVNPVDPAGSYRNFYKVDYADSVTTSASYRNTRLCSYTVDTLSHINKNSFTSGMTYDTVMKIIGILPSAAEYDLSTVKLYFGQELRVDGNIYYPLKLTFVSGSKRLVAAEFYQAQGIENPLEETDSSENT